jgi:hypothetical protein
VKAVHRTHINTVCITAEDTRFGHNKSHKKSYLKNYEKMMTQGQTKKIRD